MNILYHHRTQGKGAEGVHIREIVKAFRNLGNKVYIISPPEIDPLANDRANAVRKSKMGKIWKCLSKYLPEICFEVLEIVYNFVGYKNIKKFLNNKEIDFIYERYFFFSWSGAYLARRYNIPIILEVNEISGIKRVRGQILVRLAKWLEKKTFKKVDAIIVVSNFLKQQIEKKGISSNKIYVIPNAVNSTEFTPDGVLNREITKKYGLKDKIVLGFVGGFVKWHNLEFLVQVFKEIVSEKKRSINLMLVGQGSEKAKIEKFVYDNQLNTYVNFIGNVAHKEVSIYIKLMDICIIPHSNEYRSPIKMFEYMAMGKAIVAPGLEPIEDIITNEVNGVLFRVGNKNSLKKCLLDLINNNQKRRRLGEEARNTVLAKYLWKHNAQKVLEIYKLKKT